MLPYCVRLPKQPLEAKQYPTGRPNSHRGPLQQAIEKDLTALRDVYFGKLVSKDEPPFAVFRREYKRLRIGLLHHLRPTRCDSVSYAQLLYASCMNLLRKSLNEHNKNDLSRLKAGAFATFCLYTLHATAPLRRERPAATPYSLLPMGYQPEGHHKNPHRRNFHEPIRIDAKHYLLVQRLQEDCLTRVSRCKATACRRCQLCGLSRAVLALLPRLEWQFVQYVGPAGVEGLAGSPDYPFPSTATYGNECAPKESTISSTDVLRIDLELCVPHVIDTKFTSELEGYSKAIDDVQRSLNALDQKSNQVKRVRGALQHGFQNDDNGKCDDKDETDIKDNTVGPLSPAPLEGSNDGAEGPMDAECTFRLPPLAEGSKSKLLADLRRFVSATGVVEAAHGRNEASPLIGMSIAATPGAPREAINPRERLRMAPNTDSAIDARVDNDVAGKQLRDGFLWTANKEVERHDDASVALSVLSGSSLDEVASVTSGAGRAALTNLLSAVSGEAKGLPRRKKTGSADGKRRKAPKRCKTKAKGKKESFKRQKATLRAESDNDDDLSTATGIGQTALRDLLKRAMHAD